jgi:glycosyltransferase involved in cell wall biosynthesis
MRLGVPHYESSGWIAGSIYVRNLAAALGLLPTAEQPELVFLAGPHRTRALVRSARNRGERLLTYGYYDGRRTLIAGAAALASLTKGGSICSLTQAAARAEIDVLFPIARPLAAKAGVPWMAWVPDYQYMCLPDCWPERHRYIGEIAALSNDARYLVVSSEDARGHVERFFGRTRNVSALPFALAPTDEWYEARPAEVAAHYRLPERFIIFPAQFWKHKDHKTLIAALALLRARRIDDITLVLSGWPHDSRDPAHGADVRRFISHLGLEGQIHVLGLIPRRDVVALMRRSVGIVQPSRFEGWSALVEEARSLGKPLVLSDLAVHREQDPPNARFFPVGDAAALADAMLEMWTAHDSGPHGWAEAVARTHADDRARDYARRLIATAKDAIRVFDDQGVE